MKEKYYLECGILPMDRLHQWDQDLKSYFLCPIGNSPENMPQNTSLNNDIQQNVEEHVLVTIEMDTKDEEKFDLSSPAK